MASLSTDVDEPIVIVDYDSAWPSLFDTERARIQAALRKVATRIEHFGSTAVPGMAGKPIVDLLVGIEDLSSAKKHVPSLEALGYQNFGEIFVQGRVYLRRRGPPHFNVAMTVEGGPFWQTQIIVRDYLRSHPDETVAYSQSKRATYASGARMFSSYSQGKQSFLAALMERARQWHGSQSN
jgi:GrpB-like predicted nucleotidyltransferase (UPF0157 family)